jgi:hypothetical protein
MQSDTIFLRAFACATGLIVHLARVWNRLMPRIESKGAKKAKDAKETVRLRRGRAFA